MELKKPLECINGLNETDLRKRVYNAIVIVAVDAFACILALLIAQRPQESDSKGEY